MKKLLNRAALTATLAVALCASPDVFAADDAATMPVILTLKTNIYSYQGPSNQFNIYLGAKNEQTEFYVEGPTTQEYIWVDPYTIGTDSDGDKAAMGTAVTLSVTETNNTITVRGDASQLEFLDIHGTYAYSVEFSGDWSNLEVLDCSHDEFAEIDLSQLTGLQSLDLTDNAFVDGSKMVIGTNHPNLAILQVGINDDIDPNLELKNFPNLLYFSGRNNYGITSIDPTQNPYLISLVLEVTNITSIDVSKNKYLNVLNLSNTKVTDIDISNNPELEEFYASHEGSYNSSDRYKLTSIDVTHNPKLGFLDLSGNKLTSLDLTKCPELQAIYLQRNLLSEIDLSNCKKLGKVYLQNNLFTFATLPIPGYGWDYMYYRSPLACNFKYKVGEPIDFASSVIREPYIDAEGNEIFPITDARVFTTGRLSESDMLDPDSGIYTYENGVITFNQALSDSVFVRFSNSIFNDWDLDTQNFMVKTEEDFDKPATAFSFTPYSSMNGKEIAFRMGVQRTASGVSYPATITVDVAGETVATCEISSASLPEQNNVSFTMPATGGLVTLYLTDGFGVSNLAMDNIKISAIDLQYCEDVAYLAITNANLPKIDLSYNRGLVSIDLSHNFLGTVDFTPVRGDFEKWMLREINLSYNQITGISAQNSVQYTSLNLSNNWISAFDFKYYTGLRALDLSNNRISGELDLSALTALHALNISGNQINAVVTNSWSNFSELDLTDNYMSFMSLPAPASLGNAQYAYAPQKNYRIMNGGASLNLSNQDANGSTVFTWKYADSKEVVDASLYSLENGITRFNEALVGKTVFCEMTNPAYPDFADQPLTTTDFTVSEKPTTLVASFTPAESGRMTIGFRFANAGANAVYIDWNGDGSQYEEYLYDEANTDVYREGTAVAGATAKVYTYGTAKDVTMLFINNPTADGSFLKLTDLDLSPMTSAIAFDIHNAGLTDGSLKLPVSPNLNELVFDGNAFQNQVLTDVNGGKYNRLGLLNLANNKYTSFDLNNYPSVNYLLISDNKIESIKMPASANNSLRQINAQNNNISAIELKNLNALNALLLSSNNISTLDVSPVKNTLTTLTVAGNRFTLATLPRLDEFNLGIFTYYDYFGQQPFEVECKDGCVDLSDMYEIPTYVMGEDGYVPQTNYTVYRWFLGDRQDDVYYDYYYETFVGEELESYEMNPSDPECQTNNKGETFFYYTQKRNIIGALTNASFPSLILYTTPFEIDKAAGVENVSIDAENLPVDVFTISGVRIRHNVLPEDALEGLDPGLYIVGNRKVLVK